MSKKCGQAGWEMVGGVALAGAVAACAIPTEAPIVESQWFVPVAAESIAVAEVLPADVTVNGNAFEVTVPAVAHAERLGDLCGGCGPVHGMVVPKPAFTGAVSATVALPSTVARATIGAGASIEIRIQHNLTFDPLRPSTTERGRITVTLRSNGEVLATTLIDGADTPLPPGLAVTRALDLPAGSAVIDDITIEAVVESPAGDPAVIDTSRTVTVTGAPVAVTATNADVVVADADVSLAPTELAFDEVEEDITDQIAGATMEFFVSNPMQVSGDFTLRFAQGGADVITPKAVTLSGTATTDTISVTLSQGDIQTLLSSSGIELALDGTVSGTGAGSLVSVTPTQVIRITPRLVLRTSIGD